MDQPDPAFWELFREIQGAVHPPEVSEAQAASQANMLKLMEQRLTDVTQKMNENLQGTSTRTARAPTATSDPG